MSDLVLNLRPDASLPAEKFDLPVPGTRARTGGMKKTRLALNFAFQLIGILTWFTGPEWLFWPPVIAGLVFLLLDVIDMFKER